MPQSALFMDPPQRSSNSDKERQGGLVIGHNFRVSDPAIGQKVRGTSNPESKRKPGLAPHWPERLEIDRRLTKIAEGTPTHASCGRLPQIEMALPLHTAMPFSGGMQRDAIQHGRSFAAETTSILQSAWRQRQGAVFVTPGWSAFLSNRSREGALQLHHHLAHHQAPATIDR
jgi:hypothetical protein